MTTEFQEDPRPTDDDSCADTSGGVPIESPKKPRVTAKDLLKKIKDAQVEHLVLGGPKAEKIARTIERLPCRQNRRQPLSALLASLKDTRDKIAIKADDLQAAGHDEGTFNLVDLSDEFAEHLNALVMAMDRLAEFHALSRGDRGDV